MEAHTKQLFDHFVSPKVLTDSVNAREAINELRSDERYRELKAELAAVGFFKPDPFRFIARLVVNQVLLGGSLLYLLPSDNWGLRIVGMILVGFTVIQGTFLAHEVDHGGVVKNQTIRQIICQYLMTVLSGYCYSYFRRDHELHHFHCQEYENDPDMHSGILSLCEQVAQKRTGFARWVSMHQATLMPFLIMIWAFDMKIESMAYVYRNARKTRMDQVGLVLHFLLWFGGGIYFLGFGDALIVYAGWLVFAGVYNGTIIPVNHVGTTVVTADKRMSFVEQQVVTSRNITGPRMMDYLFMGLNLQIEHHLFPYVPSTRLRCGQAIIKNFCEKHGLAYNEVSYVQAMREVRQHFRRMSVIARRAPESTKPIHVEEFVSP